MTYSWLVENFTKDGKSTGLYMACQVNMTVTADVNAARKFRRQITAEFRALDMREARRGDWRAVEHGFDDSEPPNDPNDVADAVSAELRRLAAVEAQRDALKQTLHDELAGNLRLRDLGGARPDEPMLTFLERIIAERDALLEALRKIAAIENKTVGSDWEEIEEARDTARAAIAAVEEGK